MVSVLASTTATADGTAAAASYQYGRVNAAVFLLTVSAAAAAVGDLLDVFLQSSADGGTTYDDFVRFTQVLGNGGAKKYIAVWQRDVTPTRALGAPQDGAMAAGVNQGPVATTWRIKYKVTDGGAHGQSFTFKVDMSPILDRL